MAGWWSSSRPTKPAIPWLSAPNRWTALQAEFILNRTRKRDANHVWMFLRTLTTPSATLDRRTDLQFILRSLQRQDRLPRLLAMSEHLQRHPEDLDSREGLRRAGVPQAVMDVALRIHPVADEDPIVANSGLLRLAAFFNQSDVAQFNKRSDGRIEVARLVGVEPPEIDQPDEEPEPVSGPAHLALFELAESICRPEFQAHDDCPLQQWCSEGATSEHPQALRLPYDPHG